ALTAAGMLLLAGVDGDGTYIGDVLPGMLVAGLGLGIALVSVALSVLTGAADDEAGMLSGLNTTGHEIGGSPGVAGAVALFVLPSAASFLPSCASRRESLSTRTTMASTDRTPRRADAQRS